jgi:hypothetical protein
VAILIDQCKHGRSVPFFEQAKFKVGTQACVEHALY